eukprot:RCo051237
MGLRGIAVAAVGSVLHSRTGLALLALYLLCSLAHLAFVVQTRRKKRQEFLADHGANEARWRPFVHREPPLTPLAVLLMVPMALLTPLRIAVMIVLYIVYFSTLRLYLLGVDMNKPLPADKFPFVLKYTQVMIRIFLGTFGIWHISVEGSLPPRPEICRYTLVCNHLSYMDILIMMTLLMPAFVAKIELRSLPSFGFLCKMVHCLFIDRRPGANGQAAAIADRQRKMMSEPGKYPPLLIFPEGTTTNGTALLEFRRGAFTTGAPVIPMLVDYPSPFGSLLTAGGFQLHWECITFLESMLCGLLCFALPVKVRFLPPHEPTPEEIASPALYARNVFQIMQKATGLKGAPLTYQDKVEYLEVIYGPFTKGAKRAD